MNFKTIWLIILATVAVAGIMIVNVGITTQRE
jgi:hypothetical protein